MMPVAAILSILLQAAAPSQALVWGLPLQGAAAEEFLKSAEIVAVREFDTMAVTRPMKVELTDGQRTCYAVFKTIDERASKKKFTDGTTELQFSDRYRYEIAAYELDKLLGLEIVPPTVERRIGREVGSLSLWVEGSMTEWERLKVTDFKNTNNLLVTPDWKIYKIDSSRAFRNHKSLRREESLSRFSRTVLGSLGLLSKEQLKTHLCRWLSKDQISSLLADRRIAEHGEAAVLFD
jgi:hypothetical protein